MVRLSFPQWTFLAFSLDIIGQDMERVVIVRGGPYQQSIHGCLLWLAPCCRLRGAAALLQRAREWCQLDRKIKTHFKLRFSPNQSIQTMESYTSNHKLAQWCIFFLWIRDSDEQSINRRLSSFCTKHAILHVFKKVTALSLLISGFENRDRIQNWRDVGPQGCHSTHGMNYLFLSSALKREMG